MELTYLMVGLAVGVALGAALGVLLTRGRTAAVQGQVDLLTEQLQARDEQLATSEQFGSMVEGLQTKIHELQESAREAERRRIDSDASIREQIKQMSELNETLSTETRKLTSTLSNSASRGRFGEMQLERLLEFSGLTEGVHFTKQTTTEDRSRPDVTVLLPGGSSIFIDSKFPFDKFWLAAGTEDVAQKRTLLNEHAKDLLNHAAALSKRGYHDAENSPDFVVLFAPFESILSLALDVEPRLLDLMFEKNVVVATPTTMLALLRTIGYGNRQDATHKNALAISEQANALLNGMSRFYDKLKTLRDRFESTQKAFGDLIGTANTGVIRPANKMAELGEQMGKALPPLRDPDLPFREVPAISAPEVLEESE